MILYKKSHTQSCLKTLIYSESHRIHCLHDFVEAVENMHLQHICICNYWSPQAIKLLSFQGRHYWFALRSHQSIWKRKSWWVITHPDFLFHTLVFFALLFSSSKKEEDVTIEFEPFKALCEHKKNQKLSILGAVFMKVLLHAGMCSSIKTRC